MLKYPLNRHVDENAREEQRCLKELEQIILEFPNPVAAAVIEP